MTHVQYNKPRPLRLTPVMIGKLFLTLATLALLHGMNFLSDISHYSSFSIAAYSTYEREHQPEAART